MVFCLETVLANSLLCCHVRPTKSKYWHRSSRLSTAALLLLLILLKSKKICRLQESSITSISRSQTECLALVKTVRVNTSDNFLSIEPPIMLCPPSPAQHSPLCLSIPPSIHPSNHQPSPTCKCSTSTSKPTQNPSNGTAETQPCDRREKKNIFHVALD